MFGCAPVVVATLCSHMSATSCCLVQHQVFVEFVQRQIHPNISRDRRLARCRRRDYEGLRALSKASQTQEPVGQMMMRGCARGDSFLDQIMTQPMNSRTTKGLLSKLVHVPVRVKRMKDCLPRKRVRARAAMIRHIPVILNTFPQTKLLHFSEQLSSEDSCRCSSRSRSAPCRDEFFSSSSRRGRMTRKFPLTGARFVSSILSRGLVTLDSDHLALFLDAAETQRLRVQVSWVHLCSQLRSQVGSRAWAHVRFSS